MALALTADSFALWLVVALATVDGTLAIGARALTRASAAAVLTPHGLLREGNAIINVGFTGAGAAGPALAEVAVPATLGVQTALLIDAASFVLVAIVLAHGGAAAGEGAARARPRPPARGLSVRRARPCCGG